VQVTDLAPGTSYEYRVMAVNGQGGSPWSPIGSATTLPSVPAAPAAPAVSACSSHSLHLSWREPHSQGAPVTSYTVNMARLLAPLPRPLANGHSRRLSADSDVGSGGEGGGHGWFCACFFQCSCVCSSWLLKRLHAIVTVRQPALSVISFALAL
jgi:hypothetical protein